MNPRPGTVADTVDLFKVRRLPSQKVIPSRILAVVAHLPRSRQRSTDEFRESVYPHDPARVSRIRRRHLTDTRGARSLRHSRSLVLLRVADRLSRGAASRCILGAR
eukprot:5672720-Prymnesium_polylepis.1